MEVKEIQKGQVFLLADSVKYVPNSLTSNDILRKVTGTVSVVSIDSGIDLSGRTSPFDTFILVLEGKAKVMIETNSFNLDSGEAIIIPAHAQSSIVGRSRFKMMSTVIKSGYEEVIM